MRQDQNTQEQHNKSAEKSVDVSCCGKTACCTPDETPIKPQKAKGEKK